MTPPVYGMLFAGALVVKLVAVVTLAVIRNENKLDKEKEDEGPK